MPAINIHNINRIIKTMFLIIGHTEELKEHITHFERTSLLEYFWSCIINATLPLYAADVLNPMISFCVVNKDFNL